MLAARFRLSKRADFTRLNRSRWVIATPLGRIRYAANRLPQSRFAVVVSSKISKKATLRNQLRRRIMEIIRLHLPDIVGGYDMMIVVNSSALLRSSKELEQVIIPALSQRQLCSPRR